MSGVRDATVGRGRRVDRSAVALASSVAPPGATDSAARARYPEAVPSRPCRSPAGSRSVCRSRDLRVLFASADPIFRGVLETCWVPVRPWRPAGRIVFVIASAWLAAACCRCRRMASRRGCRLAWCARARRRELARDRWAGRSSHHPRPRGHRVRGVCRTPAGLPVRWPRHADGGWHDLQRLRATRLLRAVAAACLAGGLVSFSSCSARRSRAYVAAALVLAALTLVCSRRRGCDSTCTSRRTAGRSCASTSRGDRRAGRGPGLGSVLLVRDRMRWLGHGLVAVGLGALMP